MSGEFLIDSFFMEMGGSVGLEEETSYAFAAVPPAIKLPNPRPNLDDAFAIKLTLLGNK